MLNWKLLSNPFNYIIVGVMLMIFAFLFHLLAKNVTTVPLP